MLFLAALAAGHAWAQAPADLSLESAFNVNEGELHFLEKAPAKAVHHHQNWFRIDENSLATGWVGLVQCHDNLDAVPRAQITFREGFVRDLKVLSFNEIENAWIEGASVQLVNVRRGARLCLAADTRALRNTGNGYYNLYSGPYMRKFLDGYYPMRLTLDIQYPTGLLALLDVSPGAQPGFRLDDAPGHLRMDAIFEGVLQTLAQFEKI
ncbi:MAG: hypothetical protein ACLGG6_05590 [Gammaproteobacteria bacterium]